MKSPNEQPTSDAQLSLRERLEQWKQKKNTVTPRKPIPNPDKPVKFEEMLRDNKPMPNQPKSTMKRLSSQSPSCTTSVRKLSDSSDLDRMTFHVNPKLSESHRKDLERSLNFTNVKKTSQTPKPFKAPNTSFLTRSITMGNSRPGTCQKLSNKEENFGAKGGKGSALRFKDGSVVCKNPFEGLNLGRSLRSNNKKTPLREVKQRNLNEPAPVSKFDVTEEMFWERKPVQMEKEVDQFRMLCEDEEDVKRFESFLPEDRHLEVELLTPSKLPEVPVAVISMEKPRGNVDEFLWSSNIELEEEEEIGETAAEPEKSVEPVESFEQKKEALVMENKEENEQNIVAEDTKMNEEIEEIEEVNEEVNKEEAYINEETNKEVNEETHINEETHEEEVHAEINENVHQEVNFKMNEEFEEKVNDEVNEIETNEIVNTETNEIVNTETNEIVEIVNTEINENVHQEINFEMNEEFEEKVNEETTERETNEIVNTEINENVYPEINENVYPEEINKEMNGETEETVHEEVPEEAIVQAQNQEEEASKEAEILVPAQEPAEEEVRLDNEREQEELVENRFEDLTNTREDSSNLIFEPSNDRIEFGQEANKGSSRTASTTPVKPIDNFETSSSSMNNEDKTEIAQNNEAENENDEKSSLPINLELTQDHAENNQEETIVNNNVNDTRFENNEDKEQEQEITLNTTILEAKEQEEQEEIVPSTAMLEEKDEPETATVPQEIPEYTPYRHSELEQIPEEKPVEEMKEEAPMEEEKPTFEAIEIPPQMTQSMTKSQTKKRKRTELEVLFEQACDFNGKESLKKVHLTPSHPKEKAFATPHEKIKIELPQRSKGKASASTNKKTVNESPAPAVSAHKMIDEFGSELIFSLVNVKGKQGVEQQVTPVRRSMRLGSVSKSQLPSLSSSKQRMNMSFSGGFSVSKGTMKFIDDILKAPSNDIADIIRAVDEGTSRIKELTKGKKGLVSCSKSSANKCSIPMFKDLE